MRRKIFSLFITLLIIFFFSPSVALASSNFTTDYKVVYTPKETGITHAVINAIMTNTTSNYYPSSYRMQLGFDTITNVKASDPDGALSPVIQKNNEGYSIDLTFNTKSVGLNKKLPFTVEFDTPSIAKNYGKIREINVAGISDLDEFATFTVEIRTPESFGKPTYVKPQQKGKSLIYNKEQLGKSGISIAFGDKQFYAFHLTYHVNNPNLFPSKAHIALPPSTNYQDVFITAINPEPENVYEDIDGNWIAEYSLKSAETINVVVTGKAQVNLTPKENTETKESLAEYLKPKPYWEVDHPQIKTLARQLQTPEAIYNYVIKTLKYDFSRVAESKPRLGAVEALNNKDSAACREFTDLFIALARAAGIPAREVNGFAYTENGKQRPLSLVKDILHAWPEYYDENKKTWVMVDPTWGNTTGGIDYFSTFDFSHLAFVIKGVDPNTPIPAGDYKGNANTAGDIKVSFTDTLPNTHSEAEITTEFPHVIAGLPVQGEITIRNISDSMIPQQIMYISSLAMAPQAQTITIPNIPPFGHVTVDVRFKPMHILTNKDAQFTIRIAGATKNANVSIKPFYLTIVGGVTIGILTIIILIITITSRRLRLFK